MTVTMAAGGADVGGHGAVGINFVTRSGTNRFTGSAYEYYRAPELNSNYWFNERNDLPKNDVKLNQYGFRQGGPIRIPGLFDGRNKAFFFVNYEELRLPNNFSRTRTVLDPRAQQGWFRYNVDGRRRAASPRSQRADARAANGQLATIDPLVGRVLGYMNSAMHDDRHAERLERSAGQRLRVAEPGQSDGEAAGDQTRLQPEPESPAVGDVQPDLGGARSGSSEHQRSAVPDSTNYGKYISTRPARSFALRSTLSANLVSELRGGFTQGGASYFGQESSNGVHTFTDTERLRARSRRRQRRSAAPA